MIIKTETIKFIETFKILLDEDLEKIKNLPEKDILLFMLNESNCLNIHYEYFKNKFV